MSPQQESAVREAEKRERHKPRSLSHKVWSAVHDSAKGWHVALVDCPFAVERTARQAARDALHRGDLAAFVDAASEALLAGCRAQLAPPSRPTTNEGERG